MKVKQDIREYTGCLLNTYEMNESFLKDIDIVCMVLVAYRLGLRKEAFDIELLLKDLELKEIPSPFHILIGQLSAIKSGDAKADIRDYLFKTTTKLLEEYKNYFISSKEDSIN